MKTEFVIFDNDGMRPKTIIKRGMLNLSIDDEVLYDGLQYKVYVKTFCLDNLITTIHLIPLY